MSYDDLSPQNEIPHLRYAVWYSNKVILPQLIASFYTIEMAEEFITKSNLPKGNYVIQDIATKKDMGIIPIN